MSLGASQALATDINSLNSLKNQANASNPQAAREAAKQLESLFMHEMIKSMRQATMKSGLLDNDSSQLADSMLDQQFSIPSTMSFASRSARYPGLSGSTPIGSPTAFLDAYAPSPKGREQFVQAHGAAAERVARESGIPASYMLGQAGHETGWGRSEIRGDNGSNSFNLFGIKAGGSWSGKVKAKFRAYNSYEESFRDYARLIKESPRYAKAMQSTGSATAYASALQQAGYATDPLYASKLSRAIQSVQAVQQGTQG